MQPRSQAAGPKPDAMTAAPPSIQPAQTTSHRLPWRLGVPNPLPRVPTASSPRYVPRPFKNQNSTIVIHQSSLPRVPLRVLPAFRSSSSSIQKSNLNNHHSSIQSSPRSLSASSPSPGLFQPKPLFPPRPWRHLGPAKPQRRRLAFQILSHLRPLTNKFPLRRIFCFPNPPFLSVLSRPQKIHHRRSTIHHPPSTRHYPQPTTHNPQSAIRNPLSAIRYPLSAIRYPQSAIHNPRSTIHDPRSTIHNPRSTIHNPRSPPPPCLTPPPLPPPPRSRRNPPLPVPPPSP
jgi:hypothetical protein